MKLKLLNPKIEQLKANFFFIGILAIVIVVLWIGQSVYSAFNRHETDKELEKLLTPLNPTLDVKTLEQYRNSRITPAPEFQIRVVTEVDRQTESYILNPFTGTTTQPAAPVSASLSATTE